MKLFITIGIFSYLVGDSVQFPAQWTKWKQPQLSSYLFPSNDNYVGRSKQFFLPVKREIPAQAAQQQISQGGGGYQSSQPQQPQGGGGYQSSQPKQPQDGGGYQSSQPQQPQGGGGYQSSQPQQPQGGGRYQSQQPQPQSQNGAATGTGDYSQQQQQSNSMACQSLGYGSGSGIFSFTCTGPRPKIQNKNILWLESPDISQTVNIDIPNYEISELIQAGFKGQGSGQTNINLSLQKPSLNVNAQRDKVQIKPIAPSVNLNYAPAQGQSIHFQNDQQYQQLSGPIQPPSNDLTPPQPQYQPPQPQYQPPAAYG